MKDDELEAIVQIMEVLKPLTQSTKERVLRYLRARVVGECIQQLAYPTERTDFFDGGWINDKHTN